jgi:transposase-like protein
MEGYSVRQLSQQSGHSTNRLYRIINHWLSMKQPQDEGSLAQYRYLIFDGTFLHRPVSLVAIMDAGSKKVISGKYGVSENSERQLVSFFQPLIESGLQPISCTVDGNPQASRVLRKLWPDIITQRCLVHIQRQGLVWCRTYPKTVYARRLRDIFLQVTRIRTKVERDRFLELVEQWEEKYGQSIASRHERGRVFSDIKRARSMLLKALPNMFHYLYNPDISFTTNGLEGYFSRMKNHYRQHRGLMKSKLPNYFDWYIYLRPK